MSDLGVDRSGTRLHAGLLAHTAGTGPVVQLVELDGRSLGVRGQGVLLLTAAGVFHVGQGAGSAGYKDTQDDEIWAVVPRFFMSLPASVEFAMAVIHPGVLCYVSWGEQYCTLLVW